MALVYAQSGNLSFVALGKSLGDGMLHEPLLLAGFGLMIVGLGFKLSLVPFHLWTPDVYQALRLRFPPSWRRRAKSLSSAW